MLVSGIIGTVFSLIAAHLIAAFFFSLAMHVLDGKGGYYEGLTALVLGMIAPATMMFFAGALTFIPFGIFFASLLMTYGYVLGVATLFRASKEFFELDYAGVLVGVLIVFIPMLGAALTAIILR